MRGKEWLDSFGKNYDNEKERLKRLLKKEGLEFNEDVFHHTILKVFEILEEKNDLNENEIKGYFFKSLVTNIKRNELYACNNNIPIENVEDIGYIINDNRDISKIFRDIKKKFGLLEYNVFKYYYLSSKSKSEITQMLGYDVKPIISKIKEWIKRNE